MSDLTVTDTAERVFTLNVIELLAAIFRGPDSSGWEAIFAYGLPELVASTPEKSSHLTDAIRALQDSNSDFDDLETEYVRLFVAGRGGVVAPLYESCHLGDAPRIMGDAALSMRSRLGEAGLEISLDSNEPPDHLSIELEYLYHLLATAWSDNLPDMEAKAREFAKQDMLPWVARFRTRLLAGQPHPVYARSADLAVDILTHIVS